MCCIHEEKKNIITILSFVFGIYWNYLVVLVSVKQI